MLFKVTLLDTLSKFVLAQWFQQMLFDYIVSQIIWSTVLVVQSELGLSKTQHALGHAIQSINVIRRIDDATDWDNNETLNVCDIHIFCVL